MTNRSLGRAQGTVPGCLHPRLVVLPARLDRALEWARQMLKEYEEPALDPAKDEALRDYIARREREIPAADALNEEFWRPGQGRKPACTQCAGVQHIDFIGIVL